MLANILVIVLLLAWSVIATTYLVRKTLQAVKTHSPGCVGCAGCSTGTVRHCPHHHLP